MIGSLRDMRWSADLITMKRVLLLMVVALLVSAPLWRPTPASADPLSADCVSTHGKLRYVSSTKYASALEFAMAQWESTGLIDFQFSVTFDVIIVDAFRPDSTLAGQRIPGFPPFSACKIWFNTYYADNFTTAKKRNLAAHELGHALGVGHLPQGQIMYKNVSSVTSPQSLDILYLTLASQILW